jgi:hypothetical protein
MGLPLKTAPCCGAMISMSSCRAIFAHAPIARREDM